MSDCISVTIRQIGRETFTYSVAPGSTAEQLFDTADREFNEGEVTRRGSKVYASSTVFDKDELLIAKMVKGNSETPFDVELVRVGGGRQVTLPAMDGFSIKTLLDQLDPDTKSQFFRPDGTSAFEYRVLIGGRATIGGLDYILPRPAEGTKLRVLCAVMVKGNN